MAGAKGRPRRMDTEHSTYNVLLPETTITAIKSEAENSGVSSAHHAASPAFLRSPLNSCR
jgi:hypothetical protein